ncbi:hypothetical protein RCL_jg13772.t1 [Rhizophagus clarus]|uniref:Uncharacterized protein n=1 Tax=Rhizophagus clarus TaxID=94130 RepID=A0A8H3MDB5_9GLOM|nr:hypothetical protein RCL_jg13772.t1 [Rhizophagus clarus]
MSTSKGGQFVQICLDADKVCPLNQFLDYFGFSITYSKSKDIIVDGPHYEGNHYLHIIREYDGFHHGGYYQPHMIGGP